MKTTPPNMQVSALRKSLTNAKRRLRYWAFPPTGKSYQSSEIWEKYELASDDCSGLADLIESATGHRPKVVDVKATFQNRFHLGDKGETVYL